MSKYDVTYCNYHLSNPDKDIINRPHGSDDYLFLLFFTDMEIKLNQEIIPVKPGGCILFTPGNPQIYWAIDKFTNSFFHFRTQDDSFINKYNLSINTIFYPENFERIDDIIKRIYTENLEKIHLYDDMQDLLLTELFIECSRQLHLVTSEEKGDYNLFSAFRRARLTILTNPEREWNTKTMAALMNMGSSQFYNYYLQFFRKSPKAELLDVRIEKAKYLLKNENLPVNQVATLCGFNNISHFTRYFKKKVNISPSKYGKNL